MDEISTKGSLCTGTGGLDSALPGELSWVAETDDACSRLLKREHPAVPNVGDITAAEWSLRRHHVDLLTSGDPCQSMSVAGAKRASEDERFLWPHVIDAIDRLRPRQVFLENVQNVTSVALVKGADDWRGGKGSVLAARLADLRTAGYACRWTVLGACSVGGCHHRHRWFLRGWRAGPAAPAAERVTVGCGAPGTGGRVLLPTPNARDGGKRGTPSREHALRRAANPDRSLNLEDAAIAYLLPTPTVADVRNTRNATAGRSDGAGFNAGVTLSDVGHDFEATALLPTVPLGATVALLPDHWGRYAAAVALWAQVFGVLPPEPTELAPKGGRRLNAALSEWMMGYAPGFLTGDFARNEALRMAGNGVMAVQARAAWDLLGGTYRPRVRGAT